MLQLRKVMATLVRPDDTTQYAAGDVVANSTSAPTPILFTNLTRSNSGSNTIYSAMLIDNSNPTTKGEFELWLFSAAPTMDNDNAVFTPTEAELATLVGIIDFPTAVVGNAAADAAGNLVYPGKSISGDDFELKIRAGTALKTLYGVMVVRNAYTPIAEEEFTIVLTVD